MGIKDDFLNDILDVVDNVGETPIVEKDVEDFFVQNDIPEHIKDDRKSEIFVLNKPITVSEILNVEKYRQFYEFMKSKESIKHTITGGVFYLYAKGNFLKSLDFDESYKYYKHYKECFALIESAITKMAFSKFRVGSYKENFDPLVFFTNKKEVFDILFNHYFKERIIFIPSSFNEEWFVSKIKYYRENYNFSDEKNEYMRILQYFYNKYNNTVISEQEKDFEEEMNDVLNNIIN